MKTVALEEVAEFVRGITFKPTDVTADGVGVMRTKNVQATLDLSDVMRIPASLIKRNEKYLRPGDTLVSSANSWNAVGKACFVPTLSESLAIGGFVTALRPNQELVDPRYLYHWFTSPRIQTTLRSFGNQTTNISNLNLKLTGQLTLPLPPLDEQRRIASILDHADALRARRRLVPTAIENLRRAGFAELVGPEAAQSVSTVRRGRSSGGWEWRPLADVARLATGHTPDRKVAEYWNGDIPWISLPEIRALDGRVAMSTELRVTSKGVENSSAVVLPPGTVCFSRTASVGFVTVLGVPMATSQDFHNWVPGPEIDAAFLMQALRSSRHHLLGTTDGSTHKTIYQRVAQQFHVLLPPLAVQRQFAALAARADELAVQQSQAVEQAEQLFSSLQAQAFRGEL